MKRYIIELEPGVWIARKKMDNKGVTYAKVNARKYSRRQDAKVGLTWAEKSKRYEDAQIIEIEVEI